MGILWKYFYSLAPIFGVSTKCIDPWVLNSWFPTLQATINGKIVFRWIFIFMVYVDHEISKNQNLTINNDVTVNIVIMRKTDKNQVKKVIRFNVYTLNLYTTERKYQMVFFVLLNNCLLIKIINVHKTSELYSTFL